MPPVAPSQATVSVIIPTYNRADKVVRAIESALQQTHKPSQVIVVDDGSTDNTREILQGRTDIEYHWQPNQRQAAARNRGFRAATGTHIATLDSDDFWDADHLECALKAMDRYNAGIYIANWRDVDENNKIWNTDRFAWTSYMKRYTEAPDAEGVCHLDATRTREMFIFDQPAPSSSMVIRRDHMLDWDLGAGLWAREDLLLLMEIVLKHQPTCALNTKPKWSAHKHGDNISFSTSSLENSRKHADGTHYIYQRISSRLMGPEDLRFRRMLASLYFDYAYLHSLERPWTALPIFAKSCRLSFSMKTALAAGKAVLRGCMGKSKSPPVASLKGKG